MDRIKNYAYIPDYTNKTTIPNGDFVAPSNGVIVGYTTSVNNNCYVKDVESDNQLIYIYQTGAYSDPSKTQVIVEKGKVYNVSKSGGQVYFYPFKL
ncbi:MAG: hypothetical protein J1F17_04140 [Oscillospiraceae bacterium]|nr:hypothetical protein [Oscillospiraceae bacterium]